MMFVARVLSRVIYRADFALIVVKAYIHVRYVCPCTYKGVKDS